MSFGLSGERDESGTERRGGNRPDCAYFLLLGLCGAAFLLTIGGILTYIAFNPGSIDTRPHSPLSHIPHFHHHRKHHDRTEGHYFGHFEQHNSQHHEQQHHQPQQHSNEHNSSSSNSTSTSVGATSTPTTTTMTTTMSTAESIRASEAEGAATTLSGENGTTPGSHLETAHLSPGKENNRAENNASSAHEHPHQRDHLGTAPIKSNSSHRYHHPLLESPSSHHTNPRQQQHPHPGLASSANHPHHHEGNMTSANAEYQAKESLALAIIGGLCLTCGVLVTIIVGVFALKYDCDHEPEPNIAFLRLRSEMSLNFDPSKNNYELLMPSSSSTTAGVGSTHSIHPGGMPRC